MAQQQQQKALKIIFVYFLERYHVRKEDYLKYSNWNTRLASVGILRREREHGVGKLGLHENLIPDLKGIPLFRSKTTVRVFMYFYWNNEYFTGLFRSRSSTLTSSLN